MTTVQDYLQGVVKQAKERSGSQSGFNSRNSRNTDDGKNTSRRALQIKVKKEGQTTASPSIVTPSLTPENLKLEQGSILREVLKTNMQSNTPVSANTNRSRNSTSQTRPGAQVKDRQMLPD